MLVVSSRVNFKLIKAQADWVNNYVFLSLSPTPCGSASFSVIIAVIPYLAPVAC